MKKLILAALAFAIVGATTFVVMAVTHKSDKYTGEMVSRTFNLGDFHELEVSQINVELTQAPAGEATLTAPSDLIDKIVVKQKGDDVEVYVKGKKFGENKSNLNATLTVSSSAIKEIEANCAAEVNIKGELRSANDIDLTVSTAATINASVVTCRKADLEASTAGTLNVGRIVCTGELDAEASTAGTIKVNSGTAAYAKLEASTAGTVTVNAELNGGRAEASTGGTIKAPTANLSIEKSTGGSVKNISE